MNNRKGTPNCEVILGFSRIKKEIRGAWFFKSSASSVSTKGVLMHWSANFKFQDGQSCRLDADVEDDNKVLQGKMTISSGLVPSDEMVSLGFYECTYSDVAKTFREMSGSRKYHFMNNNCQTWVLDLLGKLGIPVPKNVMSVAQWLWSIIGIHGEEKGLVKVVSVVKAACERELQTIGSRTSEEGERSENAR